MVTKSTTSSHRQLEGTIVSAKAAKTRVVLVTRTLAHPKYGKRYQVSRRYAVHDEQNASKVGEHAVIEACRPYSRTKRWRLVRTQVASVN